MIRDQLGGSNLLLNVRFAPEGGQIARVSACRIRANSGHAPSAQSRG